MFQTHISSPADGGGEPLVLQGAEAETTNKVDASPLSVKGERTLQPPMSPSLSPLDANPRAVARLSFVEAMKTKGVLIVEPRMALM
jgi:hypothetical protein